MSLAFRNADQLEAFVKAAVRLPRDRLRRIDREWDTMYAQRAVVSELVQSSKGVRQELVALREYIVETARDLDPRGDLVPEEVAVAIFPAARAILLREVLEVPGNPRRVAAFAALTRPFEDIFPAP